MRHHRRSVATSLLLAIMACSGRPPSKPDAQAIRLEAGFLSIADERAAILAAESEKQGLIFTCMKDHGFPYVAAQAEAIVGEQSDLRNRAFAQKYGFTPPHLSEGDLGAPGGRPTLPRQPAESRTKPWSDQLDRCTKDGAALVNEKHHVRQAQQLVDAARENASRRPEVREAAERWRLCAEHAGVIALSRLDLIRSFVEQRARAGADAAATAQIQAREILAAVDTFDCSQTYDAVFDEAVASELNVDGPSR